VPNRILRDGINDSERINALSDRAELFYRRLMSLADDFGRAPRSAALLRAKLFPLKLKTWSEDDINAALAECDAQGLIVSYEVDGKQFLEIQNFGQRIRPNVVSRFPAPDDVSRQLAATRGEKPPSAARASAPPSPSPTPPNTPPPLFAVRGKSENTDEIREIVEDVCRMYREGGKNAPQGHADLAAQVLLGKPPETRHRLRKYVEWAFREQWHTPGKTKSLYNLLKDGDWDVEITERALPPPPEQRKKSDRERGLAG
jgi:hypothetical protein